MRSSLDNGRTVIRYYDRAAPNSSLTAQDARRRSASSVEEPGPVGWTVMVSSGSALRPPASRCWPARSGSARPARRTGGEDIAVPMALLIIGGSVGSMVGLLVIVRR